MFKNHILICLLLISSFSSFSQAIEVDDLYLVNRPIAGQDKTARWKAAVSGFQEVLVRKSGSSGILSDFQVQQAYRKVTSFLQRFEYTRQTQKNSEFPYVISLYFEPRLIDALIRDSKMPLWGSSRPVTLLWLAIQDSQGRRVVKENSGEPYYRKPIDGKPIEGKLIDGSKTVEQLIAENSVRRGVPIITPLMDLEDEMHVSLSDIWGRFPAPIRDASARYSADSILFGRMLQQAGKWNGKFSYLNQGVERSFEVEAETKSEIVNQFTNKLAELLCSKYCVVEEMGEKNKILMDVVDIGNFKEYKAAEDYLNSLSSVRQTEVIKIEHRHVIFKLTLLGQVGAITKGISLSQKMVQLEEPTEPDEPKEPMTDTSSVLDNQTSTEPAPNVTEGNSVNQSDVVEPSSQASQEEPKDKPTILKKLFYRWVG